MNSMVTRSLTLAFPFCVSPKIVVRTLLVFSFPCARLIIKCECGNNALHSSVEQFYLRRLDHGTLG
jgi:hypothetical protein